MTIMGTSPAKAKVIANKCHARSRAFDRYGLYFTNDQLDELADRIAASHPDVMPLRPDASGARLLVALKIDGEWLPVVYDTPTRSIVTFLPYEALGPYRAHLDGRARGPAARRASTPRPAPGRVEVPVPAPRHRDRRDDVPEWAVLDRATLPALSEALARPVPPPTTLDETLARMAELKAAVASANRWIADERPSPARQILKSRRDALKSEREALVGIEYAANRRMNNTHFDPARATDPVHLLAAAARAIRDLGFRLDSPPGEHYDVCSAIQDYLMENAPLDAFRGDVAPSSEG
jgi:hypothetical protein